MLFFLDDAVVTSCCSCASSRCLHGAVWFVFGSLKTPIMYVVHEIAMVPCGQFPFSLTCFFLYVDGGLTHFVLLPPLWQRSIFPRFIMYFLEGRVFNFDYV